MKFVNTIVPAILSTVVIVAPGALASCPCFSGADSVGYSVKFENGVESEESFLGEYTTYFNELAQPNRFLSAWSVVSRLFGNHYICQYGVANTHKHHRV